MISGSPLLYPGFVTGTVAAASPAEVVAGVTLPILTDLKPLAGGDVLLSWGVELKELG